MNNKIKAIEIHFPCDVKLPEGWQQTLGSLIGMVCKSYEEENPTRIMWPLFEGGKPLGNVMVDDLVDYDMSVLCIEVSEREDIYGGNDWNPDREELRKKATVARNLRLTGN